MTYSLIGCKSHRVFAPATHHLSWPQVWKCSGVGNASSIPWCFWQQPYTYQISWLWYVLIMWPHNCNAILYVWEAFQKFPGYGKYMLQTQQIIQQYVTTYLCLSPTHCNHCQGQCTSPIYEADDQSQCCNHVCFA